MKKTPDREKVIKGLECLITNEVPCDGCPYNEGENSSCLRNIANDALELLKEQKIMSPDEFKEKILGMFSSIWDCEIDHPVFQDKVGELMDAVVALYRKAVKRDAD